jgi:hypothetical protein
MVYTYVSYAVSCDCIVTIVYPCCLLEVEMNTADMTHVPFSTVPQLGKKLYKDKLQ